MEPIAPSKLFVEFVLSSVKAALQSEVQSPDALFRRLWGAASYDAYIISNADEPLIDSAGMATHIADHYARMIRIAMKDYCERQSNTYVEQRKAA